VYCNLLKKLKSFQARIQIFFSGAFDISEPDVYSRYTKIGVCMEELNLRKQGAKHILPYTVEGPGP
jgi:hypothetical protein